ncbi:hypothetical protein Goari_004060, partial [Gossypium aridum]|nr:hypothetical protein [Gossypium aridum]
GEELKNSRAANQVEGYGHDLIVSERQVLDWNTRLFLRVCVTVLLQDEEVEGLQIVKDEAWITVPLIPRALVVNLGNQMQIMSNRIFKSPVHKAVTNTDKPRISVAMSNEAEVDKEIGPVEALIDD